MIPMKRRNYLMAPCAVRPRQQHRRFWTHNTGHTLYGDPVTPPTMSDQQAVAAAGGTVVKAASSVMAMLLLGLVTTPIAAVHGYKRNNGSGAYSLLWGVSGLFFAPAVIGLMAAQGFGEKG